MSSSVKSLWTSINNDSDSDGSVFDKKMRYFIYYPPTKAIRQIDIVDGIRVEDIITMVQREFGLNIQGSGPAETSIVLTYNGFDLKPKWSLADLSIPSGAIIRCLYREQKAADLYIHCGFNHQILKLFDSTINIETTIASIRKKISKKLGLPLSTFCLETLDGKQRFYDEMKLLNYDIKMHDHIYLKVWGGYEKFLSSCLKGFPEQYSSDDLTRYYQLQIALHIAAFYGHMELANSAMQQGARSDRPAGEHPSRQWSCETTTETLPEMLECPIHIAVGRGHVKMVDLFVRQSILCTQIPHPISGYLPYRMALDLSTSALTKEEKQCYNEIYFYLHDKHFNLKVPLNANGEYVTSLLTSTISSNVLFRSSIHHVFVSLPFYCKIIRWYERARENAWKKYGGHIYTTAQAKRIYPKKGLLGYKVLIDGYNNSFEAPSEPFRSIHSGGTSKIDQTERYAGYSDEEREKITKMKTFMRQFGADDRRRARQAAAAQLQLSRRPPQLIKKSLSNGNKHSTDLPMVALPLPLEGTASSSEFSNSQIRSNVTIPDNKIFKTILETDNSLITNLLPTSIISAPTKIKQNNEGHPGSNGKTKQLPKTFGKNRIASQPPPSITIENDQEEEQHYHLTLPIIASPTSEHSSLSNKLDTVIHTNNNSQALMSSVEAYTLTTSRTDNEIQQRRVAFKRELLTDIEQSLKDPIEKPKANGNSSPRQQPNRNLTLDADAYIPLPDHPVTKNPGPIHSRLDLNIRQSTVQPYERYASASTRSTAVKCLQEAGHFKRKSWLKQVEISKEMVKQKVKRRIRRADDDHPKSVLLPFRATVPLSVPSTNRPPAVKVN